MIERTMSRVENTLSDLAFYPVVGLFAGATKVALGVTQTIIALALAILTFIPSVCSNSARRCCQRSFKHVAHGLSNVLAGTFEAVPILGMLISIYRTHGKLVPSHQSRLIPISEARVQEVDHKVRAAEDDDLRYDRWNPRPILNLDVDKQNNKFLAYGNLVHQERRRRCALTL